MTTVQDAPLDVPLALSDRAARQLANATKTPAQMLTITPRWLVHLLPWEPVEAGIYRLNKVRHPESVDVACPGRDESELPQTFVDYDDNPREYFLNAVTTVVDVHTRISDLYNSPYDQIKEQLRLTIETVKERQESELINNPDYGLLANVAEQQRITPLTGAPTPDDLDELIIKVWKEPAFFLAHPRAIAAFGRECTRRGVPPATVSMFGSQFITWRGVPLIPSDKIPLEDARTKILLLRVGESAPGCRRPLPAGPRPASRARAFRPLHGHLPQRHRVLPHLAVLLARRADRRRARGSRRCRGRQVPRLRAHLPVTS